MNGPHTVVTERAVTAVERPRHVVVGAAGLIATYKAPFVVRLLRQAGHEVEMVATESVLRLIGAPALAAVSGGPVPTEVLGDPAAVEHATVAEQVGLVVVALVSADLLVRIRAGRADDVLTTTILICQAPVVLAPAMHAQIWANPTTRENVTVLRERGLAVIEPNSGRLTDRDSEVGRMPEPEQIVSQSLATLTHAVAGFTEVQEASGEGNKSLQGRHIVISAGGTREPIDPMRHLGNRSSGCQGCALTAAAAERGARVTLVQAHVASDLLKTLPAQVSVVAAGAAVDMLRAVRNAARNTDAVIMAAAVADYRPVTVAITKLGKQAPAGEKPLSKPTISIELTTNPDILTGLVSDPPRPGQIVVRFAVETGDGNGDVLFHDRAKARRRGVYLLAVNAVGKELGFGDVPDAVVVPDAHGTEVARGQGSKMNVARLLISLTADLVNRI